MAKNYNESTIGYRLVMEGVKHCGTRNKVAEFFGVTKSAISNWLRGCNPSVDAIALAYKAEWNMAYVLIGE